MMRLVKKLCTWKVIPLVWTALTIFLLCIPGSAIPSEGVACGKGTKTTADCAVDGERPQSVEVELRHGIDDAAGEGAARCAGA